LETDSIEIPMVKIKIYISFNFRQQSKD